MRPHPHFRSFLGPDIAQFLAHKRSLGRRYDVEQKTLALFDAYLVNSGIGGLHDLTPTSVDQFLLSRPRPRPRSYNHLRCTLGRLFSYLVDHEKLTETPLRSAPRRARYQRTPFIFDTESAKQLLTLAKTLPSKGGAMERGRTYFVLFAVLYGLGLRVGEACRLAIKDVDLDRRLLLIRETKFYKSRLVPFGPKLEEVLVRHLRQRQSEFAGAPANDQPLFCLRGLLIKQNMAPNEPVFCGRPGLPLTRFGIYKIVRRNAASLDIDGPQPRHVSPHLFQHTAAVHLLESGVEINVIRSWLGHVSLDTTNRYAELTLRAKAEALRVCEVGSGISTASRSRAAWKSDKTLLDWLNAL